MVKVGVKIKDNKYLEIEEVPFSISNYIYYYVFVVYI
jgi:hypothetical protein